jgi:hypothetical protein
MADAWQVPDKIGDEVGLCLENYSACSIRHRGGMDSEDKDTREVLLNQGDKHVFT